MNTKKLNLSLMLLTMIVVIFSSCKKDGENNQSIPDNSVTTMEKLVVAPNFNFKTTNNVAFTINTLDNQGNPLTNFRVDILTDYALNGGMLITSGFVNSNGVLQFSRTLPSYIKEVVVATKLIGLPSESKVPVVNGTVNLTLGGKTTFNKTPVAPLTPHTTLSKVYFLCSTYDNNGVPNNIMGYDPIDNSFLHDLSATLPESVSVPTHHPDYIQNTPTDTKLKELCDVYVTFVSEGAGYLNSMGFYTYDVNNPPTSASQIDSLKIIFPNVSFSGSGGNLQAGAKVYIGRYPANTGIGWFCISGGWSSGTVGAGVTISGTPNGIKYSNPNFNYESNPTLKRHNILMADQVRQKYIIGFEDMNRENGSDNDFNDILFYVTSNPVTAIDNTGLPPIVQTNPDTDGDGVPDNSDDYPHDASKAFNTYFPNQNTFGTLAFEDLWPFKGDYDMNDVVIDYNINQVENASHKVVEIDAKFIVRASGADFQNGFGFQLPVAPSAISSVTGIQLTDNYINVSANGLEVNQSKAVIIVADNVYKQFKNVSGTNPSGMAGINTSIGGVHGTPDTINIVIKLAQALDPSVLGSAPYNPFIISNKRRGYEIHLSDMVPTDLMNTALFGTGEDNSNPASGRYFKTNKNLPWGIDFATRFNYPTEKSAIINAYLHFAAWAQSNGTQYQDWFSNTAAGYRDNTKIFR